MSDQSTSGDKPDSKGFFGAYGGQYVPEPVKARLDELNRAMEAAQADPAFQRELDYLNEHYTGRPSPVFHCANLSRDLKGAQIWLKREDLNHLGAHKINNTLGQCLLARRMGKKRVIAETGAGQHGVATAATAALMGLECTICMGEVDMERQHLNVVRMQMLGARVVAAKSGQRTLKEAVDEALELWVSDPDMFYVLGSAVGPHPYPYIVREFQSVIGREAAPRCCAKRATCPRPAGLRGRRIQRHRAVCGLFAGRGSAAHRRGTRRARHRLRPARGLPLPGRTRRAAWLQFLYDQGRQGRGRRGLLHFRRAGLPLGGTRSTPGSRTRAAPAM